MLNQESILLHIQKQEWTRVIQMLHQNRDHIYSDPMLKQAAEIFEQEFFRFITSAHSSITVECLEDCYVLHTGGFYQLSNSNYTNLLVALMERASEEKALQYATQIPKHPRSIVLLKTHDTESAFRSQGVQLSQSDWVKVFQRIFENLNDQNDPRTYFSGPRFIDVVRKFNKYFPKYRQYIQERKRRDLSITRRDYFFDILMSLDVNIRVQVVEEIVFMLEPFNPVEAINISKLLRKETPEVYTANLENLDGPKVFFSYSWDNEDHKTWVLKFAEALHAYGINIIIDQKKLGPGSHLPMFVEGSIREADKVLVIFTPNYRLRAEKRHGGVGFEYSILNARLYNDQLNDGKVIPILRHGSKEESIPDFMQQYVHVDFRKDEFFEKQVAELAVFIKNHA